MSAYNPDRKTGRTGFDQRLAKRAMGLSAALVALMAGGGAFAQGIAPSGTDAAQAAAAPAAAAAPSPDAMTNLIRLLVAKGTLTQADGDALLAQAQSEADKARVAAAPPPPPPPVAEGAVRVSRVPEAVRAQIRDEIRGEIMAQAASEGWVTKDQAAPEWTKRIRLFGDVRVRSQSELYSRANATDILDFGALIGLGPVDIASTALFPHLNTQLDRPNQLRIRARIGALAEVTKGVTAEFSLGTGDDNSPISPNASLGGGLAKRAIWLDLANFKVNPLSFATLSFGRFENPFNASELLYDNDLRFDGVAAQLNFNHLMGEKSALTVTGGAFPLDYGAGSFPINATIKQRYPTKWLFAGELKLKAEVAGTVEVTASAGYHSFKNVRGQLSEPCNLDVVDTCSTDGLAPQFVRKGNTLFAIRNISNSSSGLFPELFGLKFDFDILDLNLALKMPISDRVGVKLAGNYVRNLGFRRYDICSGQFDNSASDFIQPINNVFSDATHTKVCVSKNAATYTGGNIGWATSARIGSITPDKRGSWTFAAEYRYVQSDAVLDSLTDSDFHLGGTNAKGYVLSGEYGIADGLTVGGHWYSSNEISGDPFAIDVLQFDLRAKF